MCVCMRVCVYVCVTVGLSQSMIHILQRAKDLWRSDELFYNNLENLNHAHISNNLLMNDK